mgnify:CR=1 FL=1
MPLIKAFRMDGLGNRFIIIDRREKSISIPKEKIIHLGNLKSFHRNIEFDQIIFIEKEINNTFPITIFNSDGGEVSACGNGSRCVAYLLSKDLNNKEINRYAWDVNYGWIILFNIIFIPQLRVRNQQLNYICVLYFLYLSLIFLLE